MEARAREVPLVVVRRHDRAGSPRGARGSEPRRRRRRRARARPRAAAGSAHDLAVDCSTKTSRRFASITGIASGAPAASAASVETPATGRSSDEREPARDGEADADAGEAAGADADRERRRARAGSTAARSSSASTSSSTLARVAARSPSTVAVVDERARRDRRRGVEGERQHAVESSIERRLDAPLCAHMHSGRAAAAERPLPPRATRRTRRRRRSTARGRPTPRARAREAVEVEVRDRRRRPS